MITWTEFEKQQPALAAAGREHFYQVGVGLGFLATVRRDGGFAVYGRAREVDDGATRDVVRRQLLKERNGVLWPDFDDHALFELGVERCLLMLTRAGAMFPQGATVWKA